MCKENHKGFSELFEFGLISLVPECAILFEFSRGRDMFWVATVLNQVLVPKTYLVEVWIGLVPVNINTINGH
jgi:hypothetical protein